MLKTAVDQPESAVAREVFVDASAWYPIALRTHPDHHALADVLRERVAAGVRLVTTNLVVAETHALVATRVGPAPALAFLRGVRAQPTVVVSSTDDLEDRATTRWLTRYRDHRFSLADAVSFTVMEDRHIAEALTLDRHFAVAGFLMLPQRASR